EVGAASLPPMTTSSSALVRPAARLPRLSEDPACNVLLIEAGGADISRPALQSPVLWPSTFGTDVDWAYRTIRTPASRKAPGRRWRPAPRDGQRPESSGGAEASKRHGTPDESDYRPTCSPRLDGKCYGGARFGPGAPAWADHDSLPRRPARL